jgi:hypothetical protein
MLNRIVAEERRTSDNLVSMQKVCKTGLLARLQWNYLAGQQVNTWETHLFGTWYLEKSYIHTYVGTRQHKIQPLRLHNYVCNLPFETWVEKVGKCFWTWMLGCINFDKRIFNLLAMMLITYMKFWGQRYDKYFRRFCPIFGGGGKSAFSFKKCYQY